MLAHQGGWDEVVLVILPLVVLGVLLFLARRRALADAEREGRGVDEAPSGGTIGNSDQPPGG